jgi:hypothetical protein
LRKADALANAQGSDGGGDDRVGGDNVSGGHVTWAEKLDVVLDGNRGDVLPSSADDELLVPSCDLHHPTLVLRQHGEYMHGEGNTSCQLRVLGDDQQGRRITNKVCVCMCVCVCSCDVVMMVFMAVEGVGWRRREYAPPLSPCLQSGAIPHCQSRQHSSC